MSYNQKEQFSAIAEAIRGKDGTTDTIAAREFAARIAAIPTMEKTIFNYSGDMTIPALIGKTSFLMASYKGSNQDSSGEVVALVNNEGYHAVAINGSSNINATFKFDNTTGKISNPVYGKSSKSVAFASGDWLVVGW